MADETIGEVRIRVSPDGSKFYEQAKDDAKDAEKRLNALDLSVKFQTELEGEEQVAAEAKAAQEAAQKAVDPISIKVNLDNETSLLGAIGHLQKELIKLGEVQLPPIELNEDAIKESIEALEGNLKKISNVQLRVDQADPASLKRAIQQIDAEMAKLKPVIPIHLDEQSLEEAKANLLSRLEEVSRLELNVDRVNEASLKAAIRQIDAEIAKVRATFRVEAELTEESLQREKARLQNDLANAVHVRTALDEKTFAETIAEARRRLRADDLTLGVLLDPDKVERAVNELALMLKAHDDLRARFSAELDPFARVKMAKDLEKLHAEIAKFNPGIHLPVKPEVPTAAQAALKATLAFLTRKRDITIDLDFKRAIADAGTFIATLSTFKAFNDNLAQARTLLTGMFTNLPNFAAATTGILAMSGGIVSLTSNLIGLAGSLVQLLPLMAAIPGIAIGIGTMAVALKDLPEQLPAIVAGFKNLQVVISEAFWSVARGPINELAKEALPLISAGLKQTSTEIGGFFAALSGALAGGLLPALPAMFANLADSINLFTQYTPAIASILTMFGQLGSALLPPLAALMGQVVTQFQAWFATTVAGDQLGATINGVIAALSGVFEIVKGAAGIFGALFDAASAAGASTFGGLGLALQGIADTLRMLQPQLTAFFAAAHGMFTAFLSQAEGGFQQAFTGITAILSATLPTIGSVLGQVVGALGGLLNDPAVIQGFTAFISGVAAGITALLPAFQPIANLLGALGPTLGLLATQIGQTFSALAPSFGGILQAIMPLITVLSGGLQTVLVALSPVITKLADAMAQAFSSPALMAAINAIVNALIALMPALSPVIDVALALFNVLAGALATVMAPLAGLFTQLVPLFPMLATAFTSIFAALAPLIPVFVELLVSILTPLIPVLLQLVEAILPLLPPVLLLVSNSLSVAMAVFQLLVAAVLPLIVFSLEMVANAFGIVADVVAAVMMPALELVQKGIGKLQEGIAAFASWWEGIWNKVSDFFKGIWEGVINWVLDFLGIHSPSRVFLDIANNLIAGLMNGLTAGWGKVTGFFSNAMTWIKDTTLNAILAVVDFYAGLWGRVTGAIGDLAGKVRSFFGAAWSKIQDSLTSQWTTTSAWLVGLGSRVLSAIGNLGNLLVGIGRSIINGLWDGLKAAWDDVAGWLSGIGDKIRNLKGPEDYDAVLLVHAGELIIQGLLEGMESQYDAVRKSLSGFTNEIGGTRFGSPGVVLGVNPGLYSGDGAQAGNTLIYHAAPGSSLGAEEDLFGAIGRARAFGW
ncbi:hypothetical protein ACFOOK_26255 [Micromonospora krabiensis]|uniref:Phage-related protein n=1 Tax=Micromonospora krabiensis TaxID=307121 RepID=A0A1C3N5S2_9ACTN|nr:hypothetical protein [Micromonospora krabiensis]SBV27930.1 Phage-related protein [Micromonospora krabiensis]